MFLLCRSAGNIVGAIDWHSFSQLILRPYGEFSICSPTLCMTQGQHSACVIQYNYYSVARFVDLSTICGFLDKKIVYGCLWMSIEMSMVSFSVCGFFKRATWQH